MITRGSAKRLQAAGLSRSKQQAMKDLAGRVLDGQLNLRSISRLDDGDIISTLTQVHGIGVWSAQMFLMFTLNRPDIFPTTDLGIQKGYQKFYKLSDLPKSIDMEIRSQPWKPYRTAVSLYFWRLVEGPFIW